MNYEYYKIFYYVGKHKNITRAAAELFSSQPAVTRVIQNMEFELGCTLFVRTKTGVEFTHEGELLYDYVSVACQQLIKAEEELSQSVSLSGGTVYIGATVTALTCYLFDFLNAYREKYPNVKFKIQTSSTVKTIDSLKNGSVDMAFVTTPFSIAQPMVMTEILKFNDVLIGGKNYAQIAKKALSVKQLNEFPMIGLTKKMQLRKFVDDVLSDHDMSLSYDIEVDSADIMISMVENGWGLAIAPEPMTRESIARGKLLKIPLVETFPPRKVCLIYNPRHPQTHASRELCRMVIANESTNNKNSTNNN